jgi:hypothetical protein
MVRAITIKRRWAELIAQGTKRFEVRDYRIDYLGPLVITISGEKIAYCIVDLVGFQEAELTPSLSPEERQFGKWAWVLANPQRCVAVPCVGKLGPWYWNAALPELLQPVQLALL